MAPQLLPIPVAAVVYLAMEQETVGVVKVLMKEQMVEQLNFVAVAGEVVLVLAQVVQVLMAVVAVAAIVVVMAVPSNLVVSVPEVLQIASENYYHLKTEQIQIMD